MSFVSQDAPPRYWSRSRCSPAAWLPAPQRAQEESAGQLVGAGSTFVQPLVSQWQAAYPSVSGVNIVYQPIGSGGGIQAITNRTVDFGASDAPLTRISSPTARVASRFRGRSAVLR